MSWPRWTCASKIGVFGRSARSCPSQNSTSVWARWSASSTPAIYPEVQRVRGRSSVSTGHFRRTHGQSPRVLRAAPQAAPPLFEHGCNEPLDEDPFVHRALVLRHAVDHHLRHGPNVLLVREGRELR